jgi:hypothetical protein
MTARGRLIARFIVFPLVVSSLIVFPRPSNGKLSEFTSVETVQPGQNQAEVKTADGLQCVTFPAPQGKVIVYLPDDMAAGDTISGTVVVEPKGNTTDEWTQNKSVLDGYVIDLAGTKVPSNSTMFRWTPPTPTSAGQVVQYQLKVFEVLPNQTPRSISGAVITPNPKITSALPSRAVVTPDPKITTPSTQVAPLFLLPQIGQAGRPIEIIGRFDGNAENTKLRIGDQEVTLIAESPRKSVFRSPPNVTGPVEMTLSEMNTQARGTYRSVGVNLSAPKTNLLKGEQTTLKIELSGLQGIGKPMPLTLESEGVIMMEGGNYQPLMIQPSQVQSDGRFATTREITGQQTGGWSATATVITQPYNIVLREASSRSTILLNSFTGDYIFCSPKDKLSGTGEVKAEGCITKLTDKQKDHEVQGEANTCTPVDNGRYFLFYSAGTNVEFKVTVSDTGVRKIYFHPPDKQAPPIMDTGAFATCP